MEITEKINKIWMLLNKSTENKPMRERITYFSWLMLSKCLRDLDIAVETRRQQEEILDIIDNEYNYNFCDSACISQEIIDLVDSIDFRSPQIRSSVAEVYEKLLRQLKISDVLARDIFTPSALINTAIKMLDTGSLETIYDPACGAGGFLLRAYQQLQETQPRQHDHVSRFYGNALDSVDALIGATTVALFGKSNVNISCNNVLNSRSFSFPQQFDCIITNPPFGTIKDESLKRKNVLYTSYNEPLMLEHCLEHLAPGATCAVIVSPLTLARATPKVFVQTRERLLRECDLLMVVDLPEGTFEPYTGAPTSLLVFRKSTMPPEAIPFEENTYTIDKILYYVPSQNDSDEKAAYLAKYMEAVCLAWKAYCADKPICTDLTAKYRIKLFDSRKFSVNKYRLNTHQLSYGLVKTVSSPRELLEKLEGQNCQLELIINELQIPPEIVCRLMTGKQRMQEIIDNVHRSLFSKQGEKMKKAATAPEGFSLPKNWKWAKIKDLLGGMEEGEEPLRNGRTPVKDELDKDKLGIPCFGAQEIKTRKYIERAENTLIIRADKERIGGKDRFPIFLPGSLLIIRAGTNAGRASILQERATANGQVFLAHFNSETVETDYVYWWFKSGLFQKRLHNILKDSTAQPSWNQTQVEDIDIPLPPPEMRGAVLLKIETLMNDIEQAKKILVDILDDAGKLIDMAIMEAFHDNERREWNNGRKLDELLRISSREVKYDTLRKDYGNVQYVGGDDIEKGTCRLLVNHDFKEIRDKGDKKLCEPESILYQNLHPDLNKAVHMGNQSVCSRDIISFAVRPGERLLPRFVMWAMVSPHFSQYVLSQVHRSENEVNGELEGNTDKSGRKRILQEELLAYSLRFPKEEGQKLLVNRLDAVQAKAGELQQILAEEQTLLAQLEQSVLDHIFQEGL